MPLRKLKSFHARLFFIVLLAMLPVLLMSLFMARERYHEAKTSAAAASQQLANAYAADGRMLFDRARILLLEISMLHATLLEGDAQFSRTLAATSRDHPEYGVITYSSPDGRLIASSHPGSEPQSLSGKSWFNTVLRTKSFTLGSYEGGSGATPARLPMAMPLLAQDGSVLGVLSMPLDLKVLDDILDDFPLPEGAAVSILDRSGTVLARVPTAPDTVGYPAPGAQNHRASGQNTWEAVGLDGVERIYFLAPMLQQNTQDIYLRIGMASKVAFAAARQGLVRDLAFISGMTVFAFLLTWLFSNAYVLRQIKRLWLATTKISQGDYAYRIGYNGTGELAELATAFDNMAGELESRTFRLVTAEHKYRKIFENSVNGIFRTTPEGRFQEANPALAKMLGYCSPQEMICSVSDIGSQIYADPGVRQEVLDQLKRHGVLMGFEFRAKRKDGGLVWLSLDGKALRDQGGNITAYEGSLTDVTYRKLIEDTLKAKQEKLQALLDYSPALISVKDAECRYLMTNRRHLELHNLDQSPEGKSVFDLLTPEDARRIREEDRQVLAEGQSMTFRHTLNIGGVSRHFLAVKFPLFDDCHRPDRVCAIAYDITDYEEVRESLRQSEEKYRTMIETSPDLIWMLDARGFIIEANPASLDLLNYNPEELRGMHFHQIIPEDDVLLHDRELVLSHIMGMKKSRKASPGLINERRQLPRCSRNMNVRLIPKTRDNQELEVRYFEMASCGLWKNMDFLGTMLVARDVTERKRADEALRASQHHATMLANMLESSSQAFAVFYPDGRLGICNAAFATLLGYPQQQIAALDWESGITPPQWREMERVKLEELVRTRKSVRYEKEFIRKDGSLVPVELQVNQHCDAAGTVEYFYAFITDITEHKEIEEIQLFLLECGRQGEGKDFFLSLAQYLSQKLKADYVCIDQLEGDGLTAKSVAVYLDGHFGNTVSHALKDTPAGAVVGGNACCFPEHVRHLFPKDQALQNMAAESYAGVTLRDARARPIGLIAVIGRQPLANPRRAERLLQIVCVRAARELESRKSTAVLVESQELLAHTQAIGKIGGWSVNLDTRECKWTAGMYHVLGHLDNAVPDFDKSDELFAPEDRAQYTEVVRMCEELGESFDVELRLAQHTQRWVRLMGRREDRDGVHVLTGTFQDITDRKNLETLRDDIDNIIRHDLKTPLNGIINLPQLILHDKNLTPEQVEYLLYIEENGRRMLSQIEMSLDIMKIERGQFQFVPSPLDLVHIIRDIANGLQDALKRKNSSLKILVDWLPATESSTFLVHAEQRLCYPLLSNLILNALEASPPGGQITVSLCEGSEDVVRIRNQGVVPKEIEKHFFKKYVTSGKFTGTGLGTYSAKLFAKAQGGDVELDTSEEGFTTLSIRLPRNADTQS